MKPLVIYHANCADGFGAAFAAWLKLGDDAEYLPMQYGSDSFSGEIESREIYILDFSFKKGIMNRMFEKAKKVIWLDHHKSAFEMWCGGIPEDGVFIGEHEVGAEPTIILDNTRSGALIAWEYFHPASEVPRLIRHIDDYDRWQFELEGTKAFNKALWSFAPWSFTQWYQIVNNIEVDYDEYEMMLLEGAAILRAHEQNVAAVVRGAARDCIISTAGCVLSAEETSKDLSGLAANCPSHLASDVGHQLATQSGTYGLVWHINNDGKCLCSLRSSGDYDVSAIAKAFGGGGHKNAAGFEIPVSTLLNWIK